MANKNEDKGGLIVGGGVLIGLGFGFFFLQINPLFFLGFMFLGLGLGLIISSLFSK